MPTTIAAITRREFVSRFLPSPAHIRTLGGYRQLALRVAKWAVLAACVWFAWQIFSGVPLAGWRTLGWVVLKFVLPVIVGVWAIAKLQTGIDQSGNATLQVLARSVGRVLVALASLAAGAVFYHFWLRKPEEACVALAGWLLMEFCRGWSEPSSSDVNAADQRREQPAYHASRVRQKPIS